MIVTTTPFIDGYKVKEYHGIVFGEVIAGANVIKDTMASLTDFFGGRSGTYEKELMDARHEALEELKKRAEKLGANAIVGVDMDYETLGSTGSMLMVIASGTAVTIVESI